MDKNVLIQYVEMKEEIKDLRRRIHENERERNFQGWESITTVAVRRENRRVRQNMRKTWLSS